MNKKGKLFVISAPSGGGKTSLTNSVIERLSSLITLTKVVTFTSRKPRINEVQGRDYHFINKDDFVYKMKDGFFLETTEYSGELYGSPSSIITDLESGLSLMLITDRDGADKIRNLVPEAILIWIIPPTIEILKNRIKLRNTESPEQLSRRIQLAQQELSAESAHRIFKYRIINDVFEESVEKICSIIVHELSL